MATAGGIITAAFQKIGVGSPTASQTASALISLNNMLGGWGPLIIQPSVSRESLALTIGTATYTWGPGGNIATARPSRIENAFLRDSEGYDSPLNIIAANDYNNVSFKTTHARPVALYFIPEVTQTKMIFDCEPDVAYTLYLEAWKPFTEFAATTDTVTLPNEYKEALVYNLAISLAEDWGRTVTDSIRQQAQDMKYLISAANAATRSIPKAKFDLFGRSSYNINTDE
jgi:hypothetical protein